MRRVPPNSFAVAFGLAGLGGSWLAAADARWVPRAVGGALFLLAAAVWLTTLGFYAAHAATHRGTLTSPTRSGRRSQPWSRSPR